MDVEAQLQAIVDKLVGVPHETVPPLSAFDEPWRTLYRRLTRACDYTNACILIYEATAGFEDRRNLTREVVDRLPGGEAFTPFPSLHEIAGQFSSVEWLWPSWIPRGLLTLFGAAPGLGKSLVALDLARRIIHGEPFPDGIPVPCPGANVVIVDAEGAPALLNQRARAWDIDRRRLFLMLAPEPAGLIDLARPDQQELLHDMCRLLEPALVVVDSLAAATARGETSLEGARAILGFLSSVADEWDVPLLLIHHLRKRARSGPVLSAPQVVADDLRGSSHISAAARSVLALSLIGSLPASPLSPPADPASGAPHAQSRPHLDGPRRLEVIKTNLCRHPPPLALTFEGENVAVPVLRYSPLVEPAPPPDQVDLCARWLHRFLAAAGAPLKPADVVRAAGEAGFTRSTLYRARQALADLVVDLGTGPRDPKKRWTLAPAPSPPSSVEALPPPPGTPEK